MAREGLEIEGLDEVIRRLKAVGDKVEVKQAEKVLMKGSRLLANAVRKRAKGNIRKAVKARTGKRKGKVMATTFTAIDRKLAPHAHLVENGHELVKGGKLGKGGYIIGHVRPRPFWRPAIDTTRDAALKVVQDGVKGLLEGAIK